MEVIINNSVPIPTLPKTLLSQLVPSIDAAVIEANTVVNLVPKILAIVDSNVSLSINSLARSLRMTLRIRITIVKTTMMRTTTTKTISTMIMTMTTKATNRSSRIPNKPRILNMRLLPTSSNIGASIRKEPTNCHRILKISQFPLWPKCCTMHLTQNTMMTFSRINVITCLIGSRCEPSSLTLNTSIKLSRSLCTTSVAIGVKLTS